MKQISESIMYDKVIFPEVFSKILKSGIESLKFSKNFVKIIVIYTATMLSLQRQ